MGEFNAYGLREVDKVPPMRRNGISRRTQIEAFLASGYRVCEVFVEEGRAKSVTQALRQTLKRYSYPVRVSCWDQRVYLVRKDGAK